MFTVELKNEAVTAALTRLSSQFDDMTAVMTGIGEILVASTQDRIKAGKSPNGSAFAPRSATTLAIYERKKQSFGLPLYRKGDLYNQINSIAGSDFVEVGSTMIYASTQQFGAAKGSFGAYSGTDKNGRTFSGSAPWGNIPARPFLGISEADEDNILAEIAEALSTAFGQQV